MEALNIESRNKSILLLDDDVDFCSYLYQVAQRKGVDLHYYNSLLEIDPHGYFPHYDLIILDFDLGTYNGLEAISYCRALFGNIPMIIVSAKHKTALEKIRMSQKPEQVSRVFPKSLGFEKIVDVALNVVNSVH